MEELKHECGVALVRLLKPRDYYEQKCGTASYALNKLYLMMEKEHNRGQEGAGIACVNMDAPVGTEYMFREKALGKDAITEIFDHVTPEWTKAQITLHRISTSLYSRFCVFRVTFCIIHIHRGCVNKILFKLMLFSRKMSLLC